jgi:ribosomal protein S18 acetylase RimI-like enzyme
VRTSWENAAARVPGMEIVRLGPGDEDRYRQIRLRALADSPSAFASTFEREEAFTPDVWTSRLTDEHTVTFLAVDGTASIGEIPAGTISVGTTAVRVEEAGHAQLLGMWVAPEARGRGIGERLLDAAFDCVRARDVRRLGLWVTESNHHARALYERAGFRPTGGRQPLPSDPSLMEVQLVRDIENLVADPTP